MQSVRLDDLLELLYGARDSDDVQQELDEWIEAFESVKVRYGSYAKQIDKRSGREASDEGNVSG